MAKGKHRPGRLVWWTEIADEELDPKLAKRFGGLRIVAEPRIEPSDETSPDYPWPSGDSPLDAQLAEHLAANAERGLSFLKDQRDLGRLLLRDEPVRFDGFVVDLHNGNSPARLVQAMLVARSAADDELESEATAKLQRRRGEVDPETGATYGEKAAFWGAAYGPLAKISLTNVLGKGGPLTIRRP